MKQCWRKVPRETGLRGVGSNPNPTFHLFSGAEDRKDHIASVNPSGGSWDTGTFRGYFFVVNSDSGCAHYNSCNDPLFATAKSAKCAAVAYIKTHRNT